MVLSKTKGFVCWLAVICASASLCSGEVFASSGNSGDGGAVDCTAPTVEVVGCAEGDRIESFYFSVEENGCKLLSTCPPEEPQAVDNFFLTLKECETMCPPKQVCEPPSFPTNGIYLSQNSVENGEMVQTLTYACSHGYELIGPPVRECSNGEWSEEPVCQLITCPELGGLTSEGVLGTHELCPGPQTLDCLVVYSCEKKYQLVYGDPVRKCQSDGTWSGEQPYCGKLVIKHNDQEVEAISTSDGDENLEIDCIMIPSFPPGLLSNVNWLPGNKNTSWTTDNRSFQLKFHTVHLTDAGDYKCEVWGDSNKIERKIEIKVKEAKEEINNGNGWTPNLMLAFNWPYSNKLLCAFDAKPKASVSWYRDGELMTSGGNYVFLDESDGHPSFTMATMLVNDPTQGDFDATYVCVGENSIGKTSSSQLTIQQHSSKRSASIEVDNISLETMCSPDAALFLGKVRRVIEPSSGGSSLYHISVDKPLVASRPISQSVIKATSNSAMTVQRHQPHIFVTQRTDDKYILSAVLPYTDSLESFVSQLCS